MKHLVKEFLKYKSIDEIDHIVVGELEEFVTEEASYSYGNGELIIYPVDESLDSIVYVVDSIGDTKYLVEF